MQQQGLAYDDRNGGIHRIYFEFILFENEINHLPFSLTEKKMHEKIL